METIKQGYESWFNKTQPKDAHATQRIEVRRGFYGGAAAMWAIMAGQVEGIKDVQKLKKELENFFKQEVADGYGIPKE